VFVDALLTRTIVIGRDEERRVSPGFPRRAQVVGCDARVVRACARDDGHAPLRLFDTRAHYAKMLLGAKRRRFARRAADDESRRAFGDLPFDQISKCGLVKGAVRGEGRDERRN